MQSLRLLRRAAALLCAAGAAIAATSAAAGAASVGSDVSSNWAGYVVAAGYGPAAAASVSYASASGDWVQPAAKCGSASGPTSAAFWVGLGGDSGSSTGLEQIGTESDCTASGSARYSAWYELVPAGSVKLALKVAPGDRLAAAVAVAGTKVSVKLSNLTSGTTFSRVLSMAAPDTSSAEWIAEAPSVCDSAGTSNCRQVALTDFGKVTFSHASLTTAGGHTGTISDPTGSATALALDGSSGFGFGRYGAESGAAQAQPGALGAGGSSFAVTWSNAAAAAPPGYGNGPGFGYPGSGYGGYGGGSPYAY